MADDLFLRLEALHVKPENLTPVRIHIVERENCLVSVSH